LGTDYIPGQAGCLSASDVIMYIGNNVIRYIIQTLHSKEKEQTKKVKRPKIGGRSPAAKIRR
jgi:hypothetical protein